MIAQGTATEISGRPTIPNIDITPFEIGNPAKKFPFNESNINIETNFRLFSQQADITQELIDNPNSLLVTALDNVKKTVVLDVSSGSTPVLGGGVANTAFLQGSPEEKPNAQTALVRATFWIETVGRPVGGPDFHQLQYTETVLLNFNGLSWPHISVATLNRFTEYLVKQGDSLPTLAANFYGDGTEPFWRTIYNANSAVIESDPNVLAPGQRLNIPT